MLGSDDDVDDGNGDIVDVYAISVAAAAAAAAC